MKQLYIQLHKHFANKAIYKSVKALLYFIYIEILIVYVIKFFIAYILQYFIYFSY